jgi:hypothetical protein
MYLRMVFDHCPEGLLQFFVFNFKSDTPGTLDPSISDDTKERLPIVLSGVKLLLLNITQRKPYPTF